MTEPSRTTPANRRRSRPRPPPSGRSAGLDWLAVQAERFPNLAIGEPKTDGLDARDAAFARALSDQTIRRWFTSRWLVESYAERPLHLAHPVLRAALLGGATQLAFMEGVADHAAIYETVEWAKSRLKPRIGGVVNAVLRKVAGSLGVPIEQAWNHRPDAIPLSDGRVRPLQGVALPDDAWERLSIATSCPTGLIHRWRQAHGDDHATSIAMHGLVRAPTVLHLGDADLKEDAALTAPHASPGHAVWTGPSGELAGVLARHPSVWVQDAAAWEPVELLSDLKPSTIVDVCAGNGTKSRQLTAAFPDARIVASDVDKVRLRVLRESFASVDRVEVVPAGALLERCVDSADVVLLDVPCSNTGVLARRAEARYRVGAKSLDRLLGVQRQIIADSIRLLRPDGALLYATCSLENEENRAQADWAKQWHGFNIVAERACLPAGGPGEPAAAYRDGSYAALLRR